MRLNISFTGLRVQGFKWGIKYIEIKGVLGIVLMVLEINQSDEVLNDGREEGFVGIL